MKLKQLGKDGPWLSEIGLGTWAIGGPWEWGWGPQNDQESIESIQRALDQGINWIDTAAVYGLGHAEEIIAKALKGKREKVFIATKCGLVWDAQGKVSNNNQPESIRKEVEASLSRLQTDYIDLYQIHWPDPNTPIENSWKVFIRLKEEGKIRFLGVSNFGADLLAKCEAKSHVNSLQPPYSLLDRHIEKDILPWCQKHGTGVVAYSPLQSGILTGKFDKSKLAKDDWRRRGKYFKEPWLSKNLQFAEELKSIAERYDKSLIHLAIAWILMNPAVSCAIVGTRRAGQVDEMIGGRGWKLKKEDLEEIELIRNKIFSF
jgi:aryl-alcohol dehydrogenase-like predicted oxidoreductase